MVKKKHNMKIITILFVFLISMSVMFVVVADGYSDNLDEDCKSFFSPDNTTKFKVCEPTDFKDIKIINETDECITIDIEIPMLNSDWTSICNV